MFANKFKINVTTISSAATATTITFPINMTTQNVDNAELIDRVFVETEVENAINPIIDYEKVRFLPLTTQGAQINKIIYDIYLLNQSQNYVGFYGDVGFTDDDIKFRKESFKKTFLRLSFYDSENPLTQNLVSFLTLFSELNSSDLQPPGPGVIPGTPKPANQIPINFVVESPLFNPKGIAEGYHLYDYKSELKIGESKYLYMRATLANAKTGKAVNLMVKNTAQPIDKLVHELYTRYKMVRTQTGYYYEIDNTYQGNGNSAPNNVTYNTNTTVVKLYEIKAT